MNIYFVLSEEVVSYVDVGLDDAKAPEWGCICCLVRAETRSKAKYLAWKTDDSFPGCRSVDMAEMPSMSCKIVAKDVGGKAMVLPNTEEYRHLWPAAS